MLAHAFAAALLFGSQAPELRDREIWFGGRQYTHDGLEKCRPALSPNGSTLAYCNICTIFEKCEPQVILLDSVTGARRNAYPPKLDKGETCLSIMKIEWLDDSRIAVDCHLNPSLGNYLITGVGSGNTIASYAGYAFQPSPDGKRIAHAGFMPHFAPRFAHSFYLQVDGKTVYPPKAGEQPYVRKHAAGDANLFRNIHELVSPITWSADGSSIALVERLFEWRANACGSYYGSELADRFQLVVVRGETVATRALPRLKRPAAIEWLAPDRVRISAEGYTATFPLK